MPSPRRFPRAVLGRIGEAVAVHHDEPVLVGQRLEPGVRVVHCRGFGTGALAREHEDDRGGRVGQVRGDVATGDRGGPEPRAVVRVTMDLQACPRAGAPAAVTNDQAFGFSIPCMVSQLTKASNQPVLVVSLGYMPKPWPPCS